VQLQVVNVGELQEQEIQVHVLEVYQGLLGGAHYVHDDSFIWMRDPRNVRQGQAKAGDAAEGGAGGKQLVRFQIGPWCIADLYAGGIAKSLN